MAASLTLATSAHLPRAPLRRAARLWHARMRSSHGWRSSLTAFHSHCDNVGFSTKELERPNTTGLTRTSAEREVSLPTEMLDAGFPKDLCKVILTQARGRDSLQGKFGALVRRYVAPPVTWGIAHLYVASRTIHPM